MSRKIDLMDVVVILGFPFVVAATIQYAPLWVTVPAVFALGLLWFGALVSVSLSD